MPARNASPFTRLLILVSLATLNYSNTSHAAEYTLAIQPILPQQELKDNFQPLADYLSAVTGATITISTHRNFLFYWTKMRKGKEGFDLVLDAAHFTDYRVQTRGYTVLAKFPDTVSWSIVTREDTLVFGTEELIGLRVATMHSPSLGSLQMEKLFPNPMRIPHYVWERNTSTAIDDITSGKVDAAIIPSRLVSAYENLNIVLSTEPVPHMALSASPKVPTEIAEKIQQALLNAHNTVEGKKMLAKLNLGNFEAANSNTYAGYADFLTEVFGYQSVQKQDNASSMEATPKPASAN